MHKFWMVYSPNLAQPQQHKAAPPARLEAERLAQAYPGETFFLLEATEAFVLATPVQRVVLESDEISF
jgi:Leu/Phe-tRNA-protein transferase